MKLPIWLASAALAFGFTGARAEKDQGKARQDMVTSQIQARGISDEKVLAAMREIPREEFVPESQRAYAYDDRPLPIGHGQTISQPYVVALMTELLEVKPESRVLEVGTGSGYQAAILSPLVKEVYSIEIVEPLAETASAALRDYKNVHLRTGDGYEGWKEAAPFDAIIVTCAPDHVPQPLVDQLRDGGRMVIPVGASPGSQSLYVMEKTGDTLREKAVLPVRFVPLVRPEGSGR